jgi:hypothetical protein
MNFQEKVIEMASDLRTRSLALAQAAIQAGRVRAQDATRRAAVLQGSLDLLGTSGRELNKVVRRHAVRFVKENSTIVRAASKDVSEIARDTYASFTKSGAKKQAAPTRKSATSRKRARARVSR